MLKLLFIKFIHFSAEEQAPYLIGSKAYVNDIVIPQDMNILLVINIDEVGGVAGRDNNTVTCERDEGSPWGNNAASFAYTDTLTELTQMYTDLNVNIAHAYGSDYMPFEDAGYIITGFYETNESQFTHSPWDILANMDANYVTQVAKATVAAALYFAKVNTQSSSVKYHGNSPIVEYRLYPAYPNPFNATTTIRYDMPKAGNVEISIHNTMGQEVLTLFQENQTAGFHHIYFNGASLPSGIYIVTMLTHDFKMSRRVLYLK